MEHLINFITQLNQPILILPLVAVSLAQIIKLFVGSNQQKFSWRSLYSYSGMPSGHSALTISLATIVGLREGWHSPLFAITAILAIIVIRDALGIRRYLGEHGRTLNILVKDLEEDNMIDEKYPHLLEKIGHTPDQVIVGGILGMLVSLVGNWWW